MRKTRAAQEFDGSFLEDPLLVRLSQLAHARLALRLKDALQQFGVVVEEAIALQPARSQLGDHLLRARARSRNPHAQRL